MLTFTDPAASQDAQAQAPKLSDQDPKNFLLNYAKRVNDDVESIESRVRFQNIITMLRRHRGITASDRFGKWTNNMWAESPRFEQLHGTNIFQSLIKGAESNYYEAQIKLDISAKSSTFANRSVERISRSIYEILDVTHWGRLAEQELFYASVLKNNAYVISRFNKSKPGVPLQKPEFSPVGYEQSGTAVCPDCYSASPASSQTTSCPECGGQNLSVIQPPSQVQDYNVSGFSEVGSGETETVIASALEVSIDDRDGRPADVASGGWAEWRYMAQKSDLQRMYKLELKAKPNWSYPTRLKIAFKRFLPGEAYPTTDFDKQTYEVRQIWMDLAEYQDYVSPVAMTVGGLQIQAGEGFATQYPDGMLFAVVNDEIAFCDGENKNEIIKSCLWVPDAGSHYGVGAYAGIALQKKINILDNMAMEGEARSMKGSLAYDPQAIDGAHLEGANTNVPLRPDFVSNGEPIKNFIMPIEVTGLSQSSLAYLATQVSTMQRVMGIPDVTLGEGDPAARTAAGQSLIDRNATGLLIPAKRSEGAARAGWLMDQLKLIQKYYPQQAIQEFGTRYGEEFLDDEVQAFLTIDLSKAIRIEVVAGSEIPESRFEKQQKMRSDIANGFIPLSPDLQAILARESGYEDFDLNAYESNEKLADKRYTWIKQELMPQVAQLEQAYEVYEGQLTNPNTGQRAQDGMGNPVPNPVVQQLLTAPVLQINKQAENHQQQYAFWAKKCRELMASAIEQPRVLIATCDAMMTMHNMAIFEAQTKQTALNHLSTVPAQGVQGQMDTNTANAQQPAPPPEQTPAQKIVETIAYKDLPPEGQRELAQQGGLTLPLSAFKAVHPAMVAAKKQAAPVAKKKAA